MPTAFDNTVTPTEKDIATAAASGELLRRLATQPHDKHFEIVDDEERGCVLVIPAPAIRLLNEIMREMAKGNAVTLLPVDSMLTTQEAADMLNVSRPFLIGLLDAGKIRYRRLGSHRKIQLSDLIEFKERADAAAAEAMRTITQEAQELGMGY